ncbi:hypothetical protein PSAC2689_150097 [Paraburkholderia sacchari]
MRWRASSSPLRRPPQPLPAARQMHAHRRARAFGIVSCDGVENALVLAVHEFGISLGIAVRDAGRIDAMARNQRGAHLREDVDEIAIAGGARHRDVELQIGARAVAACARGLRNRIERRANRRNVALARALRRESRAFRFQADAQLQHREQIVERARGHDFEIERLPARLQHEAADAMARLDHRHGLQPRDGLAHHGAAHAQRAHETAFGRQFVAWLQGARSDLLVDVIDGLLGKIATAGGYGRGARLGHRPLLGMRISFHYTSSDNRTPAGARLATAGICPVRGRSGDI